MTQILEFFAQLFESGLRYSSLNTARALGIKLEGVLVGKNPYVICYMRGIFNIRPSQPRYIFTWDVNRVLEVQHCT